MTTEHIIDCIDNKEFVEASDRLIDDDELITIEGENFARFSKPKFIERRSKMVGRGGTGCTASS